MRTLTICDDDAEFSRRLAESLRTGGCALRVSVTASVQELAESIERDGAPDILLMDIVVAGDDGVAAVGRLLRDCPGTQVIYITGFIENCSRVYETPHVWFLTKPLRPGELQRALAAALERLSGAERDVVSVKSGSDIRLIPKAEVIYVESEGRKLTLHTLSGTQETYAKLDDMARLLGPGFVRCHKSFCVNLSRVTALSDGAFHMGGGVRIPISQKRYKPAREAFLAWLESRL